MTWFIAFLGILLSFWLKYMNRTDKTTILNPLFWVKDNYPELFVSILSMLILLIIAQRVTFDESKILDKFPWISSIPIDLIVAAVIGYLNNTLWYWLISIFKKKVGIDKPIM